MPLGFKTNKYWNTTLEDTLSSHRKNNFNLIRLFLALGVLYTHCFLLFNSNGYGDVLVYVFKDFDSGIFAVSGFFMISGMLLSQSFHSSGDRVRFVLNRIFRIFPALVVVVLLTILVFGALGTELPLSTYYTSRNTYRYLYNIFLNNNYFIYNIPGSFETNYFPKIINGSLWTLPYELLCYITLFFTLTTLYYLRHTKGKAVIKSLLIASVIGMTYYIFKQTYLREKISTLFLGPSSSFRADDATRLYVFFFGGVLLFYLRKYVRTNPYLLILILALNYLKNLFFPTGHLASVLEYLTVVYLIITLAGFRPLFKYNWKIDPSYGIYLYAWPIQQILARYFTLNSYESLLITIPLAFLVGAASYVIVEKPALDFAKRLSQFLKSKSGYKKVQSVENFKYS